MAALQGFDCLCQMPFLPCTPAPGPAGLTCRQAPGGARQQSTPPTDALTLTLRVGALVSFRAMSPNLTSPRRSPKSATQWPADGDTMMGMQAGMGRGSWACW